MLHSWLGFFATSLLVAVVVLFLFKYFPRFIATRVDGDTAVGARERLLFASSFPNAALVAIILCITAAAQGRRRPAPQQRHFWEALLSVNNVTAGSVLQLPHGADLLGNSWWGSGLLVRHCYRGLFDRMMKLHASGTYRKFLITGTPGIGKSFFIIPLMYWLAKEKGVRKIVLDITPSLRYLFSVSAGRIVDVVQGGRADLIEELQDPEVWWIVDVVWSADNLAANTVLLSSPDWKQYKKFLKLRGATLLYMPVWEDEEIEKCRSQLLPTLPAATVQAAQSKWGNIPRYVLEKVGDVPAQDSLDTAIGAWRGWEHLMLCIAEPESAPDSSHKLVHLHVVGDEYNRKVMQPASSYVIAGLEKMAGQQHVLQLQNLVDLSMVARAYAAAAGAFFAHYAHRCLQRGGVFKVRRIDQPGAVSEDMQLEMLAKVETFDFKKLEDMQEKGDNVYGMPRAHNFSTVDAIMQPRVLFQMTITQKGDMSLDGPRPAVRQLRRRKKQLYFAVPSRLFYTYRCDIQIPRGVEQWVLEVPWN